MDMKLYEIDEALEKCFDPETGEIIDADMFEKLSTAREDKIEGVGCIIKNREALIETMKAEKARLTERIAQLTERNEKTKDFLDYVLAGHKFETARVKCSYRKSKAVEIVDQNKIPEEYITVTTKESPDKVAIGAALKDGKDVPGCCMVEHNNLTVK